MSYRDDEYMRIGYLMKNSNIFNGDKGNGVFMVDNDNSDSSRRYPFVLNHSDNNLFNSINEDVKDYFNLNHIKLWSGQITNHTLSSQVACLNHLFAIRNDSEAVFMLVEPLIDGLEKVLVIETDDRYKGYIQFEAVTEKEYLNEGGKLTRGEYCTSIDALIYGQLKNGKKVIFPIEWKYTEYYGNENMASDDKGKVRRDRYDKLVVNSSQLKPEKNGIYYYEPFYQLMRQTLWAEQIVADKDINNKIQADDYLHIHVIPKGNYSLLGKTYPCSGKDMEKTWRSFINNNEKYIIITPEEFLKPAYSEKYKELFDYLDERYWKVIKF